MDVGKIEKERRRNRGRGGKALASRREAIADQLGVVVGIVAPVIEPWVYATFLNAEISVNVTVLANDVTEVSYPVLPTTARLYLSLMNEWR